MGLAMSNIDIREMPDNLASRLRAQFPGATGVDSRVEFVKCEGIFIGDRFGGTARLGTNPTSERLVADIRRWLAQGAD